MNIVLPSVLTSQGFLSFSKFGMPGPVPCDTSNYEEEEYQDEKKNLFVKSIKKESHLVTITGNRLPTSLTSNKRN